MASRTRNQKISSLWKLIITLVLALVLIWLLGNKVNAPTYEIKSNPKNSKPDIQEQSNQANNPPNYSLTNSASIWVIVNKRRAINPPQYKPELVVPAVVLKRSSSAENMHVSQTMAPHLEKLFAAAGQAGQNLMLSSGFRSYGYQQTVYSNQVDTYGQAEADRVSARPGHSEHQTGLAADVAPASGYCDLQQCFGYTPSGKWLKSNAYRYGFVIRYPEGKESVTGYSWEPWHIRYIGKYAAGQMHKTNTLTLEAYFDTGPAPTYR